MASNPMQKKARNSFLLGMLLMLIFAAIAIVLIVMIMNKNNKKQKQEEEKAVQRQVYVVQSVIKSGQQVTEEKLALVAANEDTIPENAYGINNFYDSGDAFNIIEEDKGLYKEVKNDDNEVGYVPRYKAKIDLTPGMIVNRDMLYEGEELQAGERIQEYNVLQLPLQLEQGEFIDVRFQLSNGQDYIVISHKEVMDITEKTIWLQLKEEEILLMSNAIVESYMSPATNLYVTKYVEPGLQTSATVTYVPSNEVLNLIYKDKNIIETARDALVKRYSDDITLREYVVNELNKYSLQALDNIQSGMQQSRQEAITAREEYLTGADEY